ncbi:AraC family transcriptional regulator [Cellvibrio sp. NN19]|uniref:AraC family transcriptional regulator n=1 Tax=Cellvibrio chitinivorans TaxID=3102792 RepID=UPI002B407855|nr:AraC family transcriptional regulator [Cellvibrio sp. NN19]
MHSDRDVAENSLKADLLNGISSAIDSFTKPYGPGDYQTSIPGLIFYRRESPSPPAPCQVEPSVVLVAQGEKKMWLGGKGYPYDNEHFLITSLDLPANSEIVEASPEEPCLGLVLNLDMSVISELIIQGKYPLSKTKKDSESIGISKVTNPILDPFFRLVELLKDPDSIHILAPMIQREIFYRLLLGEQASKLRQVASVDGNCYRIAMAIEWLKLNLSKQHKVEDIANQVQMSSPTFHHHFRQLTSMSPVQYLKWLRLSEAKRLMLNENLEASTAAYSVGYESPSQFSREYKRLFGTSPKQDILTIRKQSSAIN